MRISPVTDQDWLFTPPLDMPLQLGLENGRFDSLRPRRLPSAPPCTSSQLISGDDPSNPTGVDVHFANGLHQAVDLASVTRNCVYAAYSGRVARVETNPAQTKGNVTIDHHPRGLEFVTNYNHITRHPRSRGRLRPRGRAVRPGLGRAGEPDAAFRAVGLGAATFSLTSLSAAHRPRSP
jgi:hypothetical protein